MISFRLEKLTCSVEYKADKAYYPNPVKLEGNKIVITYPKAYMPSSAQAIEEYIALMVQGLLIHRNAIKDVGDYKGSSTLKCDLAKDILCVVDKAVKIPIDFFPDPASPVFNWQGTDLDDL